MNTPIAIGEIQHLWSYLLGCETAAAAPPAKVNALLGLLGAPTLLGRGAFVETLAAVPGNGSASAFLAGIVGDEPMAPNRAARIDQLQLGLRHFPAFAWLSRQPAVLGAKASFERVAKRRNSSSSKLSDDCAVFRFWLCAAWAALHMGRAPVPSPTAVTRRNAATAARRLLGLSRTTRLLRDARVEFNDQEALRRALSAIIEFEEGGRGKRNDAHSADREFIDTLTHGVFMTLGCAPPSIIVALAALKVANPDQVAITKRVKLIASALQEGV